MAGKKKTIKEKTQQQGKKNSQSKIIFEEKKIVKKEIGVEKVKIDQKEAGQKSIQQYQFGMMIIYRSIDIEIYCLRRFYERY